MEVCGNPTSRTHYHDCPAHSTTGLLQKPLKSTGLPQRRRPQRRRQQPLRANADQLPFNTPDAKFPEGTREVTLPPRNCPTGSAPRRQNRNAEVTCCAGSQSSRAAIPRLPREGRRLRHNNLILQHDNAPAHNATVVKNTIKDLGWGL
ncbi:hypothetical protein LAZ67_10004027 [Cordylochernes scorpioides]|uniref:Transposase n=1 Tax=Cordylochernes scorpioides TaxID=51811 RepID=A0ABY6KXW2_9ARAC|nr:hypothetical protein LAZ67_10004027 [Cordylochernes scorpioides]